MNFADNMHGSCRWTATGALTAPAARPLLAPLLLLLLG